jgi:8-oxo-dGTP diphosphatase
MSSFMTCALGHDHYGPLGAAGLLLVCDGQVLLQERSGRVHQGGTWSTPGGALEPGEDALAAAAREAHEELGLEACSYDVTRLYVAECGGWTYTTVVATVPERPTLVQQWETARMAWLDPDDVARLPLHPAFRDAWEDLHRNL